MVVVLFVDEVEVGVPVRSLSPVMRVVGRMALVEAFVRLDLSVVVLGTDAQERPHWITQVVLLSLVFLVSCLSNIGVVIPLSLTLLRRLRCRQLLGPHKVIARDQAGQVGTSIGDADVRRARLAKALVLQKLVVHRRRLALVLSLEGRAAKGCIAVHVDALACTAHRLLLHELHVDVLHDVVVKHRAHLSLSVWCLEPSSKPIRRRSDAVWVTILVHAEPLEDRSSHLCLVVRDAHTLRHVPWQDLLVALAFLLVRLLDVVQQIGDMHQTVVDVVGVQSAKLTHQVHLGRIEVVRVRTVGVGRLLTLGI